MPVGTVACQPRDLQTEDDAGLPQTDFRHQLLKSLAIGRGRSRLAEIAVDYNDTIHRPPQSDRLLAEVILPERAFFVLNNLAQRGLPYVQISVSIQMVRAYLFVCGARHVVASW